MAGTKGTHRNVRRRGQTEGKWKLEEKTSRRRTTDASGRARERDPNSSVTSFLPPRTPTRTPGLGMRAALSHCCLGRVGDGRHRLSVYRRRPGPARPRTRALVWTTPRSACACASRGAARDAARSATGAHNYSMFLRAASLGRALMSSAAGKVTDAFGGCPGQHACYTRPLPLPRRQAAPSP